MHSPFAMEGALDLAEIPCIHAQACAAGWREHGLLTREDRKTPIERADGENSGALVHRAEPLSPILPCRTSGIPISPPVSR